MVRRFRPLALLAVLCVVGAGDLSWAAPNDLEIIAHTLPATMDAASFVDVTVELANVGDSTWDSRAGFFLSYHWFGEDGSVVVWDGERTPFPAVIAPGDRQTLLVRLRTPDRAGRILLQWDVVHEGVRWLSERAAMPPRSHLVEVVPVHDFAIPKIAQPAGGWAGSTLRIPLELCNRGTMTWPATGEVALAAHWLDATGEVHQWEGTRSGPPRSVSPGDCVTMTAQLQLPSRAGRYLVQWDMVDEDVCWFSDRVLEMPPPLVMVVLPGPYLAPATAVWTLLLALVAALAGFRRRHLSCRGWWEVLWLGGVLWLVQLAVLDEARMWPDGSSLTFAGAGLAPLLLLVLLIPLRWRPMAAWLTAAAGLCVVQVDLLYLRYFSDLPSVAALAAAHQTSRIGDSIVALLRVRDLWLWSAVLLAAPLLFVLTSLPRRDEPCRRRALAAILAAAALATAAATGGDSRPWSSLNQVFRRLDLARDIGVYNAQLADLAQRLVVRWSAPSLTEGELADFFARTAATRSAEGPWSGRAAGCNVLMIQAESLQSFVLGLRVGGREVTPNLNRWRAHDALAVDLEDQSADGRSSDSEFLTQVSLLPLRGAAAAFLYPSNRYTGLALVLRERGYHSLSAVPFDGGFWNRRQTHAAFGYEENLFAEDFAPGDTIGWGLNDVELVRQMLPRLGALPQPFCAWMITLSLHHPFADFPDRHKRLDVQDWEGKPLGNYIHTMHFLDRAVGELEQGLSELGLLGNTVVVLWGDHDAGLEWTPELARVMDVPATPVGWYRSQRVPLLIRAPGAMRLAGELSLTAGQMDVAPTVLALLGVDPAPFAFLGRNLLGSPGDAPVVGEYLCWSDRERIFLRGGARLEEGECLDRNTLRPLPPAACAKSFDDAVWQQRVSEAVLAADAQTAVHDRLRSMVEGSR